MEDVPLSLEYQTYSQLFRTYSMKKVRIQRFLLLELTNAH